MANDDRMRGMFGYEGEGFDRGAEAGYRGGGFLGGDYAGGSREAHIYRGQSAGIRDPRPYDAAELTAGRGWNIGRDDDRGDERGDERPTRPSYRGRGPKNYRRSDERIREDVCERLTLDDHIDATEVEVEVADGIVTLTGSVTERFAKRRAEDISESVHGVKDVENKLRVARVAG